MGDATLKVQKLEDQVAFVLLNLSNGNPLPSQQTRTEVVKEILADLKSSFLKCTVLPYGLDELGISEDLVNLYVSVDTFGKVDVTDKSLHGCLSFNVASYSTIAQQIFKILTINSTSYQYISTKSLTVYANTAFGNLMPTPVPELTFIHGKTKANCKIRLENYLSVQRTRLFAFYSRLDVRVWPLFMFVRHWGSQFKALEAADYLNFQNYSVILLLVYFLMTKKIIPPLKELQSVNDTGVDKPFIFNNYDISFCSNVSVAKTFGWNNPALQDKELRTLSIVSLLKGFFTFCSEFDFKTHVVCPFLGESFKREIFNPKTDWKNLPGSLGSYLNGIDGNIRPEKLYLQGPMCLQDIFELTTNVTRSIIEEEAVKFYKNCKTTAEKLEEVLNQSNGTVFSDIFSTAKC